MTDSRIGQVKYLGNILKTDVVQYKPLPHDAFSFGGNAPCSDVNSSVLEVCQQSQTASTKQSSFSISKLVT